MSCSPSAHAVRLLGIAGASTAVSLLALAACASNPAASHAASSQAAAVESTSDPNRIVVTQEDLLRTGRTDPASALREIVPQIR